MKSEPNEIITWIETSVQNTPALFTADRINRDSLLSGINYYEVSVTDEGFIDYDIVAKEITSNFAGTLLTIKPLKLDEIGVYKLNTKRDLLINSRKNFSSIEEFIKKY